MGALLLQHLRLDDGCVGALPSCDVISGFLFVTTANPNVPACRGYTVENILLCLTSPNALSHFYSFSSSQGQWELLVHVKIVFGIRCVPQPPIYHMQKQTAIVTLSYGQFSVLSLPIALYWAELDPEKPEAQ